MTKNAEMVALAADWRAIEAWDASIAADQSFSAFTRKRAGERAAVARRYAEECEADVVR